MKQALIHLLEVQIETMLTIKMRCSEGGPTFKRMSDNCDKLNEDLKRLKQADVPEVASITSKDVNYEDCKNE